MRTTSSFEIFPNEPSERELARARWLRREGRIEEAEAAYRGVIERQPGLRTSWTECFDLLRSAGQLAKALSLATEAEGVFSTEAFPLALKGAALIEQDRIPDAIEVLEVAVERDPNLALTWHELGYAAYRLGNGDRALLALDRAFALEPHTETLVLRGRIFREAGEYYAAEVAFEGAADAAAHDDQRAEVLREIDFTRRLGAFAPRRLRHLTPAERWFAQHGAVVIASHAGSAAPTGEELIEAFIGLAEDREWSFGQILTADDDSSWTTLTQHFGVPTASPYEADPDRVPLLIATRPPVDSPPWAEARRRIHARGRGAVVTVWHADDRPVGVDLVGGLEQGGIPVPLVPDTAAAAVMAQHPGARLADRHLGLTPDAIRTD
jgi:Flp pilus assembly protein TadD